MVKRNKALELECIKALEGGNSKNKFEEVRVSDIERATLEKEKAELE